MIWGEQRFSRRRIAAVFAFALPVLIGHGQVMSSGPGPSAWIASSLQRVGQADTPSSQSTISLYGAQNEYVDFQVAIHAPAGGLTNVTVSPSDLITADQAGVIASSNVILYREVYVYVDQATPDRGGPNFSDGPGWYADPLIPFLDPHTGHAPVGGQYPASPFNVAASTNQPIWVDLFIPAGTAPGLYSGTLNIISDQGSQLVMIALNVWNFMLPLEPSMKSVFMYWTQFNSYSIEDLLQNKIMPQTAGANAAAVQYMIENFGLNTTTTGFWSGAQAGNCTMSPPPTVVQFQQAANADPPGLYLVNYTADEIDSCTNLYSSIQEWARNMHQAGINNLIVMDPVPALFTDGSGSGRPAVDVWVVLPAGYISAGTEIPQAETVGSQIWSYNTLSQDGYSPKWLIDFNPIGMRLQAGFISQTLNLTGLLYWRVDDWGPSPWTQVNNEGTFGSGNYPGEGVLVYPGAPAGLSGVAPSIRLKQLRDGIQDYEYVQILKQFGRTNFALQTIDPVAPDWINWTRDATTLTVARQKLGDEIHRLSTSTLNKEPRQPR